MMTLTVPCVLSPTIKMCQPVKLEKFDIIEYSISYIEEEKWKRKKHNIKGKFGEKKKSNRVNKL